LNAGAVLGPTVSNRLPGPVLSATIFIPLGLYWHFLACSNVIYFDLLFVVNFVFLVIFETGEIASLEEGEHDEWDAFDEQSFSGSCKGLKNNSWIVGF